MINVSSAAAELFLDRLRERYEDRGGGSPRRALTRPGPAPACGTAARTRSRNGEYHSTRDPVAQRSLPRSHTCARLNHRELSSLWVRHLAQLLFAVMCPWWVFASCRLSRLSADDLGQMWLYSTFCEMSHNKNYVDNATAINMVKVMFKTLHTSIYTSIRATAGPIRFSNVI